MSNKIHHFVKEISLSHKKLGTAHDVKMMKTKKIVLGNSKWTIPNDVFAVTVAK